jgi:hypothetical protein
MDGNKLQAASFVAGTGALLVTLAGTFRARAMRILAKPRQLVIAGVTLAAILGCSLVFMYHLIAGSALSDEEIARARSGVIIFTSPDPTYCKQLRFDNAHGDFGKPSNSCAGEGQLGDIRRGFRGE